jgi:hypothetical protein
MRRSQTFATACGPATAAERAAAQSRLSSLVHFVKGAHELRRIDVHFDAAANISAT